MNSTVQRSSLSDTVYAVDLAKNVFEVHTFGPHGACRKVERLSRKKFVAKFTNPNTERGVVVMEACASSHHWGRQLSSRGYWTQLVPPQFVAQRRVGNKNDGNDADTIYAVYRDPRIRPVPVKTLAQQDLAALHRTRELLVAQRTQCINQIRGLLAERGVVERAGTGGFQALMKRINQEDLPEVTTSLQHQVALIHAHVGEIDAHLKVLECELDSAYQGSVVAQRVHTIFGVGLITATACAAEYGGGVDRFHDSREFAANIGTTPRERSSGEKRHRGAITKRGNCYLRKLLVQCANIILNYRNRHEDPLCQLARRLLGAGKRRSVVVVAIANRLARTIYAVIKHGDAYRMGEQPACGCAA